MNYINGAIELFKNCQTCGSATVLAIAAFVLGAICSCLVCKLFGGCSKKSGAKSGGCCAQKSALRGNEERPFEKRKPHPAPADGSVEIYVGNLSYEMTEEQLRKEFEAFGTVNSARLIMNKFNGKSKGFGFVQMPNRAEAEKACEALNDKDIMGRKMKCNEAKNTI
jgi:hypothetical protein